MIFVHNHLIEIPQWNTINLIEAIWLLSGIIALAIASVRIRPLWEDYSHTKKLNQRDLCMIARGYLRREMIRMTQAACVIGIGIYAVVLPAATPGPARTTLVGIMITATLVGISLLIAAQSVLDWRDRNEIRRIVGDG